ncbi:alpha/beta fold hydrolase [Sphingobium scionense]|uniref:Pimeloyl-ACP methyl ester carboxylesterase n=2 Tax=Sphingobium scionense TaxID=1404341 RepID=A0A7W6PXQ3_9SPHN|nr:pimeloyl-ACP methyl ester carboxylesterase [Sphingobium scionense]
MVHAATKPPRIQAAACQLLDVPPDWALRNPVDCGWVTVPAHRGSGDMAPLKLWVFRIRAYEDPARSEPRAVIRMVGGPIPRLQNMSTLDSVATRLSRRTHDVIFFDYRGVGQSEPRMVCHVDPVTGIAIADRLASKIAQYGACRRQIAASGVDMRAVNSRDNGLDVADIARAMGYKHYAIRAGSYSNLPAFDLMRTRPDGLYAAAIDTVSPPNSPLDNFISAFGDGMERWQRACDLQPACKARFPDLAAMLGTAFDRLERQPLVVSGRHMTAPDIAAAIFDLGFDSETLPFVPLAIEAAAKGDAALLVKWLAAMPPGDFTMPDMTDPLGPTHATLVCAEGSKGHSYRSLLQEGMARYPYLARAAGPLSAVDRLCTAWRGNKPPANLFDAPAGDIPVLLLSAALDPSRSPADGRLAARTLSHATVLELPGRTHLGGDADCQYHIEAAFLADPAQPLDHGCVEAMDDPVFALEGFEPFLDGLK